MSKFKFIFLFLMITIDWTYAQTQAQTRATPPFNAAEFCMSFVREQGSRNLAIPGNDGQTVTRQCTNWLRENRCETIGGSWLESCKSNLGGQLSDIQERYRNHNRTGARGQTGFAGAPDLNPINPVSYCTDLMGDNTTFVGANFSNFCSNPSPEFKAFICRQPGISNCNTEENFQRALFGFLETEWANAQNNPGKHPLDFLRQFPTEMAEVEAAIIAKMQADGKNICRLARVTEGRHTYTAVQVMSSNNFVNNNNNNNPTILNTIPNVRDSRRRGDAALRQAIENARGETVPANQRCGYFLGGFYANREGQPEAYCSLQFTDNENANYEVQPRSREVQRPHNVTGMRFAVGNLSYEEQDNRAAAGEGTTNWTAMMGVRRMLEEVNYCREYNEGVEVKKRCLVSIQGNDVNVTISYRMDGVDGTGGSDALKFQVFNESMGGFSPTPEANASRQALSYICNPDNRDRLCPDGMGFVPQVFTLFEDLTTHIPSGVSGSEMSSDNLRQLCINYNRSQAPARAPRGGGASGHRR